MLTLDAFVNALPVGSDAKNGQRYGEEFVHMRSRLLPFSMSWHSAGLSVSFALALYLYR